MASHADPGLHEALLALARSLCRQTGARAGAVVFDDGTRQHVVATQDDDWPRADDAYSAITVSGLVVGSVCVRSPQRDARQALADASLQAAALLASRERERQLEARLERERMAAAAGSDWLWETDADGVLTWVSDSVVEHTGWPASVEIGMHSMNINRPPPGAAERESWDRYRAQRAARLPFRDGIGERGCARGTMLVAMSGRPRFDADGRFLGYRGAARDVTAEVAQRQAAQQARQMLLQAMDAVHAGLMISGPDGRVLAANAAWQRQVGRFATGAGDTWESLLRAMVAQGVYPDAAGREEEFVRWRLSLATPDATPHELHFADQVVLVCDQRLPDGSTVHLSVDVSERQRAARQRRETEARLSAVLRAVPDLWFVVGADDAYLMCSDEQHPLLIEPFDQQRGQRFGDVLAPPFDRRAREALARARETGEMQRLEYESTMPDGRRRIFEARLAPMGDGNVLYLTRDLTELRRMERELVTLQRAVEADAAMPLVVTDSTQPDQPIVYVNAAFERLTGYPRDEALGRNCRFLMDPQREQPGLVELRSALAEGRPCTVVLANRRRDGSGFLNELSIVPIRDARGAVIQHLGVLHDVTERVRAAERLRISEELYRSVAATISDGLIVAGPDGRILACNPSACDTLASDAATLAGRRLSELGYRLHDSHDQPLTQADHPVQRVLRGGDGVREMPLVVHRPDGVVRRVLLTARALSPSAGSKALSCLVSFRDVTDQQAAAQALLDKQAAELASRAKSEFLSRMSHEMRTPLNAVIGFTQLLRMQPEGGPSKVAEYADHILRASEHLLGLVNEVLDLQRVEEGRAALEPRPIELAPFLESTLDLLRPAAQAGGIALASQVPGGHWVLADERCLRQVLMNMVSNAVKYNRPGGWVLVTLLDAPPGRCTIAIEDTGSGLTDEQLARLFQPFERLGHETTGIEGTGLGLVITRSLIEQMGGSVTLSSVPGAGTLARIELPAAESPDTAPAPLSPPQTAVPAPPTAPRQPLRVLYVEDNRINALLFEEAMRLLGGIELQIAESGEEALRLIEGWTPQVLVLDANLPDMNGHELLARLRDIAALAALPAFMCSADAMPEDLERARASGFQGYWTKPIEMAKVSAALDALRETTPG
jgi:PAS domain S-box-containing protein